MRRTILAALLALLLLCTGCKTGDVEQGLESSAAPDAPVIRVMCATQTPQEDFALVSAEAEKLGLQKIGVRIQLEDNPASGAGFYLRETERTDLIYCSFSGYQQYADKGYLAPLDDLLEEYGEGIRTVLGEEKLELARRKGELYGVPKAMGDIECEGVMLAAKYLDKYQIDLSEVRHFEDLEPILDVIHRREPDVIPYVANIPGTPVDVRCVIGDVLAGGLAMVYYGDDSLRAVNLYETPEYEARVRLLRKWYQKGYLQRDAITNIEIGVDQVSEGNAFCTQFVIRPDEVEYAKGIYGDTAAFLALENRPHLNTESDCKYLWCVNARCEEPEAAMKVLNLLYTDSDFTNLLCYGVEGTHYVPTGNGHFTYPEGVDRGNVGYASTIKWMYNGSLQTPWEGTPLDIREQMKAFNASAVVSPAYGFQYDESRVKDVDLQEIQDVIGQYRRGLGCGMFDVNETLPVFREKLRTAGAEELVAETQRQLDQWKAEKTRNER